MDKTEYKIRAEEIKTLIRAKRFVDAVRIADTIDWKRVKSVGMLCAISDLYKINRRLEESRDILLLAYDRSPTRREIVYSLCELEIAMGEFVQAVEYYKEFVRLAPRNTARYILQYKLYEAQEVSLEERIAVLEEYKKHDYNEKWAYELAYLYHRVGLTTECIEECDELFLYLREGRYVIKALELKSLHEPLSPEQKAVYAKYKAETGGSVHAPEMREPVPGRDEEPGKKAPTKELPQIPEDFEAGEMAADTAPLPDLRNLQAAGYEQQAAPEPDPQPVPFMDQPTAVFEPVPEKASLYDQPTAVFEPVSEYEAQAPVVDDQSTAIFEPVKEEQAEPQQEEYYVPTVNVDGYNTIDLQKEIAENLKEVLTESPEAALFADAHGPQVIREDDETEGIDTGDMYDTTDEIEQPSMSELFYEDNSTGELETPYAVPGSGLNELHAGSVADYAANQTEAEIETQTVAQDEVQSEVQNADPAEAEQPEAEEIRSFEPSATTAGTPVKKTPLADELKDKEIATNIAALTMNDHALYKGAVFTDEPLQDEVPGAVIKPNVRYQVNSHFDKMLSQDYDGQISMAIDDKKQVEEQITGQISISDFMSDWESYKKDQQRKQLQSVKKLVASETGELFKDFDQKLAEPLLSEDEPDNEPLNENPTKESPAASEPAEEQSQEITAVEDLQNTTSMVELTGADLEYARPADETVSDSEDEETESEDETYEEDSYESEADSYADEEEFSDEELGEDYPDDEDAEAAEIRAEKRRTKDEESEDESEPEVDANEEPDDEASSEPHRVASDVELGETTEISSAEIEAAEKNDSDEKVSDEEEKAAKEPESEEDDKDDAGMEERIRVMTPEEKDLFGPYIHYRKSRKQIIQAIDNLSMAAYTNNAIVTGEEGAGTVNLAKGLIRAVQATDSNFSGKVAMITAIKLNKSSVSSILEKIVNGALIIRRAADLKEDTVTTLLKQLQNENKGYIVVIEDTKDDIDRLLDKYPDLRKCFNVRVDIEALDDDSLVAYAKQYALEKEHVIDNLGILALHQKISERQTLDHEVTVSEVKEMVDDAIYYADKRSVGHYFDILLRKRYDEEDMIILREKDFLH